MCGDRSPQCVNSLRRTVIRFEIGSWSVDAYRVPAAENFTSWMSMRLDCRDWMRASCEIGEIVSGPIETRRVPAQQDLLHVRAPAADDAQLVPAARADLETAEPGRREPDGSTGKAQPLDGGRELRVRTHVDGQRPVRVHLPDRQEACHGRDRSSQQGRSPHAPGADSKRVPGGLCRRRNTMCLCLVDVTRVGAATSFEPGAGLPARDPAPRASLPLVELTLAYDGRPRPRIQRRRQVGRGVAARARASTPRAVEPAVEEVSASSGRAVVSWPRASGRSGRGRGDRAVHPRAQPLPRRRHLPAACVARRAARRALRGGHGRRGLRRPRRLPDAGCARPGRRDRLRLAVVPELRHRRAQGRRRAAHGAAPRRPLRPRRDARGGRAAHEDRVPLPPEQPDRDDEHTGRARRAGSTAFPSTS